MTPTSFTCGATAGSCVPQPVSLGSATDVVVLELFATGVRHLSSLSNIFAQINGISVPVLFAGAQPQYTGLDQINVQVPGYLAVFGQVNVAITVRDTVNNVTVTANVVTIAVQ